MNTRPLFPPAPEPWGCPDCAGTFTATDDGGERFTHDDGCPVGRALDHASAVDREFFATHPGASEYWRDLLPGDLGIASLACIRSTDGKPLRVRVRQVVEGVRIRRLPANAFIVLGSEDANRVALRFAQAPEMPDGWAELAAGVVE